MVDRAQDNCSLGVMIPQMLFVEWNSRFSDMYVLKLSLFTRPLSQHSFNGDRDPEGTIVLCTIHHRAVGGLWARESRDNLR